MAGSTIGFLGLRADTMTVLCLLLFVGACGKSAQLGLHTWLPDAMEGPTPVSALIHAATMVTAGVFMVCRLSPMFETSPVALDVVRTVGAATCLFAATCGLVQTDIKRVIAYSTCSQLGYMFFAAGIGAYGAAMFHLFTHAFFKALLFLGAGSVIHAMHHEQDMRYYGGLRKSIPLTFWAMLVGTLAITGVGIEGVFGFAGFYSKDAIIVASWAAGQKATWFVGALVALLTSFYSWRLMFLTFWGAPRWAASEHIQHALHAHSHGHRRRSGRRAWRPSAEDSGDSSRTSTSCPQQDLPAGTGGYHPHESPWTMLVPLGVLSLGAVFAGFVFHHFFIAPDAGEHFWRGTVAFREALMEGIEHVPAGHRAVGDDRDAAGAGRRLVRLYPRARHAQGGRRASGGGLRLPAPQMVFRRAVPSDLRPPRLRDRAAALASWRRGNDRSLRARTASRRWRRWAAASRGGCRRDISIPMRS